MPRHRVAGRAAHGPATVVSPLAAVAPLGDGDVAVPDAATAATTAAAAAADEDEDAAASAAGRAATDAKGRVAAADDGAADADAGPAASFDPTAVCVAGSGSPSESPAAETDRTSARDDGAAVGVVARAAKPFRVAGSAAGLAAEGPSLGQDGRDADSDSGACTVAAAAAAAATAAGVIIAASTVAYADADANEDADDDAAAADPAAFYPAADELVLARSAARESDDIVAAPAAAAAGADGSRSCATMTCAENDLLQGGGDGSASPPLRLVSHAGEAPIPVSAAPSAAVDATVAAEDADFGRGAGVLELAEHTAAAESKSAAGLSLGLFPSQAAWDAGATVPTRTESRCGGGGGDGGPSPNPDICAASEEADSGRSGEAGDPGSDGFVEGVVDPCPSFSVDRDGALADQAIAEEIACPHPDAKPLQFADEGTVAAASEATAGAETSTAVRRVWQRPSRRCLCVLLWLVPLLLLLLWLVPRPGYRALIV